MASDWLTVGRSWVAVLCERCNTPFTQGLRPSCDRVASEKWPLLAVTRNDSYWGRHEVSMVVGTISPFRTAQNTRKVCAIDELKKACLKIARNKLA